MVQENEIITLLLGIGLLMLIIYNYSNLKNLDSFTLLFGSIVIAIIGWGLTILEEFYFEEFLNLLEHLCYLLSTIFLVIWIWIIFKKKRDEIDLYS